MRSKVLLVLGLSVSAFFQGEGAKGEQGFAVVQTVRSNQLHLFAPVSVNQSKIMWFLVDTGAPKSLISAAVRKSLSLPSAGAEAHLRLVGMPSTVPIVYAQSIKAMDMELGPGYFVQAPITFSAERTKEAQIAFNKEGLIGMDFLMKHGAVINCRTQQIFFSRTGSRLPLSREGYEKMGFTYVPIRILPPGYPEVEGKVGGTDYSFIVDTGSFWTAIDPDIQRTYRLHVYRRGWGFLPYSTGMRAVPFTMAQLPELRIGDFAVSGEILAFERVLQPSRELVHHWGGLIGADLLFKRHAIIDLGNRALYLMADKKK